MLQWAKKWLAKMALAERKYPRTVEEMVAEACRIKAAHEDGFRHPEAVLMMTITQTELEVLEDHLYTVGYVLDLTRPRYIRPHINGVELVVVPE